MKTVVNTMKAVKDSVFLKHIRVLDPAGPWDQRMDLMVHHGKLVYVAPSTSAGVSDLPECVAAAQLDPADVVAAEHLWAMPGAVDLGVGMTEPGYESKGPVSGELTAAAAAGFSDWVVLPETLPVNDTPAISRLLAGFATAGLPRIWPLAALTQGLAGQQLSEMMALKQAGCVAVTQCGRDVADIQVRLNGYRYAHSVGLSVMSLPQDATLSLPGGVHDGAFGCALGLPTIPACAETIAVARDIELAAETGVALHFLMISSADSVALIEQAQRRGLSVTCGVSLAHLLYTDAALAGFHSVFHVRPPLREERDRQALLNGLKSGVITNLCTDHRPHEPAAKAVPFAESAPGMSVLDGFVPGWLSLVNSGALPLKTAVAALTSGPRHVLRGQTLGSAPTCFAMQQPAEFVVLDPAVSWNLNEATGLSAGRNSPNWLSPLVGKVVLSFISGKAAYRAANL